MRELHAWENGHHVGVFSEDDEERISFAYDANEGLPISLSLPRTGGWRDQAPRNFLDNLLPDNPNVRQAMREHLNASSAGVFDLLDRVDATGGLVFSLSPEPPIPSPTLRLISDSQIANEIDRIERTRNYWWDEDSHCRFSLGGAQGKFTLSRVDGKWYWPDMMLPSTHIVKPKPHDLPEATKVELATMRLSELCGIDTPARGEITAQRKTAYIVERFDRRLEEGRIVRLGKRTSCKRWDCRPATNTIRRPMTAWISCNASMRRVPCPTGGSKGWPSTRRPPTATHMRRTIP